MSTLYFDAPAPDSERRERLYAGDLYVFSPRPSSEALCAHAREMIGEAFDGLDPLTAQYEMPVEQYVSIVAPLKPKFIHHPHTKELVRGVLDELGCDLETTYQDVPRLRMVTSDGYLTSGVGYAHHPHRDVWYSAPHSQLNWWLPVFEIESSSSMAFHPRYWDQPVHNGSAEFNYYEWNSTGRKDAAKNVKSDTRKQPKPEQPMDLDDQLRAVCPPGGIVLFSAAQMHSTVPNTTGRTRYSIDFRTVDMGDAAALRGAPNLDSACTGTSLRDFLRASDLAPVPDEIVALHDDEAPEGEALVFQSAV